MSPRIIISSQGIEIGDWGTESPDSVLDRFAQFVADRTGATVELGGFRTVCVDTDCTPDEVDVELWVAFCEATA